MAINDRIQEMSDELTRWRRDIHAHPELGFEEHRTAQFVADKLEEFGLQVHRGVGKTGVVGVLKVGNETAAVGLRADLDALPMQEKNSFSHVSKVDGCMHACGHDGHTVMLLAAARDLAQEKNFRGTVNFIFQPAEEGIGGARAMLADGLFQQFPCDRLYAMHNAPGLPLGQFAATAGVVTAAGAFFDIQIQGRGAHGAFPNNSIDPVVIAAELVSSLQTVVSRNVKPADTAVLSVTKIHAGDAYNVIPHSAQLAGTIRTFSTKVMSLIETRVKQLVDGLCAAHGAQGQVDFRTVFHPVINDAAATDIAAAAASQVVGTDQVLRNLPPGTGSEDFSFMLEEVPGCYLLLGNGDGAESQPVHHPEYDFNDDALVYGASFFTEVVKAELASP